MSSVRKPLSTALISIAIFIHVSRLAAQTTASGGIAGVVSDPNGEGMPNAVVEFNDPTRGTNERDEADDDGVDRVCFVSPSPSVMTVSHPQFQCVTRRVTVALGPTTTVNVSLRLV